MLTKYSQCSTCMYNVVYQLRQDYIVDMVLAYMYFHTKSTLCLTQQWLGVGDLVNQVTVSLSRGIVYLLEHDYRLCSAGYVISPHKS